MTLTVDFTGVQIPERNPTARRNKPTFQPSPQQADFFKWVETGTGSCILEAVAGSGKTTTLVHALELLNGRVYFGAYNKAIAEEIRTRAPKRDGLFIGTMHAAGFKVWKRSAPNCQVDGKKCHVIYSQQDWPKELTGAVLSLVSYLKQMGYSVTGKNGAWIDQRTPTDLIEHFNVDCLGRDQEVIDLSLRLLDLSNKQAHLVIDFDDMIYVPLLNNCRFFQHDWVLIDEAQDTNATRRELALRLLKPNGRLVAVGDRHQAIYGFTGADANSLDLIQKATGACRMPLTVTYRCPKAVVAVAQKYVSHIQAADTAPDGIVKEMLDDELDKSLVVGDVVLCRFNRPLIELAYDLISQGKPAKVEGRDIGNGLKQLARKWKCRGLADLVRRLERYLEAETFKLRSAQKESSAVAVEDKVNCLLLLVTRVQLRGGDLPDLINEIDSIFADGPDGGPRIVLCSIHKSKGREWHRVYWLQTGPSPWARMDWEIDQETNLCYVAATRAKAELILTAVPTSRKSLTKKAKSKKEAK